MLIMKTLRVGLVARLLQTESRRLLMAVDRFFRNHGKYSCKHTEFCQVASQWNLIKAFAENVTVKIPVPGL
jgi:hypothetical protein